VLTTVRTHGFAADPELPQRDGLLDAEAVAERLPALLGLGSLRSCNLLRAKYRIGESLRVVYRLDTGSREHLLAARAFPAGRGGSAYRRAVIAAVPGDGLPPVVLDQESEAVWWTFPNDRRLLGLSDLMHPLGSVHPSWQRSEAVEYAPERSVTLRATALDGTTAGYAKVFAPGSVDVAGLAGRYRRIAAALAGRGETVQSPDALCWSDERQLLLLSAMPGVRWADLPTADLLGTLRRLGAAIAALHDAGPAALGDDHPAAGLQPFTRLALPRVTHSAELVGLARPDVAARARRLAARLAGAVPAPDRPVLLHGDCHPKNALVDAQQIGLIDLDQAGTGAAANDIGSLLARLRQDELIGGPPAAELAAAFLAGYAGVRPPPVDSALHWHTAAALLAERAMRAVNRVHLPALQHLDELLAEAERTLSKGVLL